MEENGKIVQTNEEINENWIGKELEQQQDSFDGVVLESFKPAENKTETIQIDISEPWRRWDDGEGTTKKIIPVLHDGMQKNFWLNVKNPIYRQILEKADQAQKEGKKAVIVKLVRTGQMKNTRYTLVD